MQQRQPKACPTASCQKWCPEHAVQRPLVGTVSEWNAGASSTGMTHPTSLFDIEVAFQVRQRGLLLSHGVTLVHRRCDYNGLLLKWARIGLCAGRIGVPALVRLGGLRTADLGCVGRAA